MQIRNTPEIFMRTTRFGLVVFLLSAAIIAMSANRVSEARQFRQIIPIPSAQKSAVKLPGDAVPLSQPQNLDREQVRTAVEEVITRWNNSGLDQVLAEEFFDKSRLTDAIDTIVPRDASLRVQSIQGVQTLQQYRVPGESGSSQIVSIVSATVNTQLEFNDPQAGFVRRQGLNEFILKITHQEAEP